MPKGTVPASCGDRFSLLNAPFVATVYAETVPDPVPDVVVTYTYLPVGSTVLLKGYKAALNGEPFTGVRAPLLGLMA
jgi:hypothetical protein